MNRTDALPLTLLLTIGAAVGSMRLWWLHATRMEQRYLVDYCRYTLGVPSFPLWPYRIEAVQHLPVTIIPGIFGGRPLCLVLLWPLLATAAGLLLGIFIGSWVYRQPTNDRLLQGAPIVSHWRWNWPLQFRRSQRGFYIDTD